MSRYLFLISSITTLWLSACSLTPPSPTESASLEVQITSLSSESESVLLPLEVEKDTFTAYDFIEQACAAVWSNNGEVLPCPGNTEDVISGSVLFQNSVTISGNIVVPIPALITLPAQEGSGYYAIFGTYPFFSVENGDIFKATLTCLNEKPNCNVQFALEYLDEQGNYGRLEQAKWSVSYDPQGAYLYAQADLSILAGENVQFILAARDNGDPQDDWAVWINPVIWRDPDHAIVHPTFYAQEHLTNLDQEENIPGVISGMVDMQTAPPYLYESGLPVVIVFFNETDQTYWWVHSNPSDQSFQMTVTPGVYTIIAYGVGVGAEPYVSAAYSGNDPSCGNDPAAISVGSNQKIEGILINDWNWTCSGSAAHPFLPAGVPIPQ